MADYGVPVITEPSVMSSLIQIPSLLNKVSNFVIKATVCVDLSILWSRDWEMIVLGFLVLATILLPGDVRTLSILATKSVSLLLSISTQQLPRM